LDLSVLPNPSRHNTADIGQTATPGTGMNPYPDGLPDSVEDIQAKAYANLFHLFLKYRDKISRVTFWGVDDGTSWLNDFPIRSRTNYPLLFDRAYQPKKAFYSVIAAKTNATENK
ncbi:MAG TPA: endo-1,4-beta-xylanase, partial [Puia sp.]|nr:endo-1,4-beta-xylanase [Puia sp.]